MNAYGDDRIELLTSLPRAWDDRGARKRFWANVRRAVTLTSLTVVGLSFMYLALRPYGFGLIHGGMSALAIAIQITTYPVLTFVGVVSTIGHFQRLRQAYRLLRSERWRLETVECGSAVAAGSPFGYLLADSTEILLADVVFTDSNSMLYRPKGTYTFLVAGDIRDGLLIRSNDAHGYFNSLNVTSRKIRLYEPFTKLRAMAALLSPRTVDYLDDTEAGRRTYLGKWLVPNSWITASAIAAVLWSALAVFGPGVMQAYHGADSIRGAMVVEKTYVIGAGRAAERYYDGEFRSDDGTVSEYLVRMTFESIFARGSKITLIKSGDEFYPGFVNLSVLVIVALICAGSLTIAILVLVVGGVRDQRRLGALAFATDHGGVKDRPYRAGNYENE
ncbi:MAG: hypothetical protein RL441_285 [Actinomycetota bacterium]